ncbi:hypothetical protein Csa_001652 [Cucumis sativus]|uniref:Uncharacterized protein n=1 Tax=Cucumis sativus TaxID=3659 RepID=A0A0A0L9M1_CUCSA|nr:hypothetical protein Csa_001652 [Cucumis sativus]
MPKKGMPWSTMQYAQRPNQRTSDREISQHSRGHGNVVMGEGHLAQKFNSAPPC